jgi:misacylated tRNA(Ala) deacylase
VVHRDGGDANYLSSVADAIAARRPDLLLLLTASNGDEKEGAFLVAGPADAVAAAAPKLEKVIEGRGGGRKGRYQGKCVRIDQRAAAATLLATLV